MLFQKLLIIAVLLQISALADAGDDDVKLLSRQLCALEVRPALPAWDCKMIPWFKFDLIGKCHEWNTRRTLITAYLRYALFRHRPENAELLDSTTALQQLAVKPAFRLKNNKNSPYDMDIVIKNTVMAFRPETCDRELIENFVNVDKCQYVAKMVAKFKCANSPDQMASKLIKLRQKLDEDPSLEQISMWELKRLIGNFFF